MFKFFVLNLLVNLIIWAPVYGQTKEDFEEYGVTDDLSDFFSEDELDSIRNYFNVFWEEYRLDNFNPEKGCLEGEMKELVHPCRKLNLLPEEPDFCIEDTCLYYDYSEEQWKEALIAKTTDPSRKLMCEELSNGCPSPTE